MNNTINIYCDESCHLEHDKEKSMVLGAVWCPEEKTTEISRRINEIKIRNGMDPHFEIKWNKVSPAGVQLYVDIFNYFFDDDDLHFRAVIADKTILNHSVYNQTHDEWYYKIYFQLLKSIVSPEDRYGVYVDIKDTHGTSKIIKLKEILENSKLDFDRKIFQQFQQIRSDESAILQLSDLLIGALSYETRELSGNKGKEALIQLIKDKTGYSLKQSTLYKENKLNIFIWDGKHV